MSSDSSLLQRVERLENDRDSLYELIDEFRAETRSRFDSLETRFEVVETRFDSLETRFDSLETRFEAVDGFRAQTLSRFDRIEETLAEVLRRLPEPI